MSTRCIRAVPVSAIDIDRIALHKKTLAFAAAMRDGALFPPIKLAKLFDGRYRLLDGRHRYTATKLLERRNILARFSERVWAK